MKDFTIYRRAEGSKMKVESVVARVGETQRALESKAAGRALMAEFQLKSHEDSGASYITVEHGDVDFYVILDDERGLGAAMSIEFGREKKSGGRTKAVHPLKTAFPEARIGGPR